MADVTRESFIQGLHEISPEISKLQLGPLIAPELVSPLTLNLPKNVLQQAQHAIQDFFKLRKDPAYTASLHPKAIALGLIDPGNYAVCMSHDFHMTPQGKLKLIEVNTNASFLFLSQILYRAANLPNPIREFGLNQIRDMIETEISLNTGERKPKTVKIAIVDHAPEQQKLYAEFLFAKSLFEMWGWECKILSPVEIDDGYDFIYNRSTDFYLKDSESSVLRERYMNKTSCVSPNPFEYFMTADKERLSELSIDPSNLGVAGKAVLLECKVLTDGNRQELFEARKKYFFKPLRSYGAKQSYRGDSISHKAFESLVNGETLAQEYIPAPEVDTNLGKFKYDLRFFSYQGHVQSVVARLYQGQVTNLKTAGGGFAAVIFH